MGKYEVSPNLITQLQILLRKEAGYPSFNPSSHPSVPHDTISAVGSKCKDCHRELLRGSESVICVYCGFTCQDGSPRKPVSFTSTLGYHWLLHSLSLDGSERVERLLGEGTQSDRARSLVKDEIQLSEYLDLQLKWPDESSGFGVKDEGGKRSSKLVGVDFDELSPPEESREHTSSSSSEQVVASDKIEARGTATVPGQSSLSLFQDTQLGSGEEENDESSDWAAEFQTANAEANFNHASHINSVPHASVTSITDSKSGSPFNFKPSEGNIVVEDIKQVLEPVSDASLELFPASHKRQKSGDADRQQDEKRVGDESLDEWDEFSVYRGAENNRGEPSSTTVPGPCRSDALDTSDPWNDLPGSIGAEHDQLHNKLDIGDTTLDGGNDVALWNATGLEQEHIDVERTHNGTSDQGESLGLSRGAVKEVDDSFEFWDDFKSSAAKHVNQQQSTNTETVANKLSAEVDSIFHVQNDFGGLGFGTEEQVTSSETVGVKSNGSHDASVASWNDNSLDAWSDFAGSTSVPDSKSVSNETSSSGPWMDLSSLMVNHANQSQRSDTKAEENRTIPGDDNGFGSWSDFSSSVVAAENSVPGPSITRSFLDEPRAGKAPQNITVEKDNNPLNSWDDFEWSSSSLQQQSHAGGGEPSENILTSIDHDLFSGLHNSDKATDPPDNQLKSDGIFVHEGGSTIANDDVWSDFTSSSDVQANSWLSSSANSAANKEAVNDDPFDGWNLIVSSSNNTSSKGTLEAKDALPDTNLFSTYANSQGVGSNSSLHPDPFLGIFSDQNGSAQVARSQTVAPDFSRTEHGDVKADEFDQLKRGEKDFKEKSEPESPVVETLISDMHDLSFMLESSLSIPKNGTLK